MGITGLLTKLKPVQKQLTLDQLNSTRLAIDGYSWLHKATIGCSYELANGLKTESYLKYFIKRINMLKRYNIKPYFVFDGAKINVKEGTEIKRLEKRILYKKTGISLWNSGKHLQAIEYFKRSVDVTPEMAKCIMEYCQSENIDYIVAPFEADSQMVYLEKQNLVDGIISEDSDLLIFGCKNLITKLNDKGEARQIESKNFNKVRKFDLSQLTPDRLRFMVCLAGCDYTKGIPHIGLSFAYSYSRSDYPFQSVLRDHIDLNRITELEAHQLLQEFHFADCSFRFQRVFCPIKEKIVPLNEIPSEYLEDPQKANILNNSIGKVVNKHTQTVDFVKNDNDIDHNAHRLISKGEKDPSDFQRNLINREKLIQETGRSQYSIQYYYMNLWKKYASPLPLNPIFNRIPIGNISISCN